MLGLTTMPADPVTADRLADGIAQVTGAQEVWLTGDAVTAHAGALPDGHGIVMVVGTGIACLGIDASTGRTRRVDGDGFLLGDAGASFWIGSRGIEAALRSVDGRGAPTTLAAAAEERFGPLDLLPARLHAQERPVNAVAQFAAIVQDHARDADAVAAAIVTDAGAQVVASVLAAAQIFARGPVPVALAGRAVAPGTPLRSDIDARLRAEPGLEQVDAAGHPARRRLRPRRRRQPARIRDTDQDEEVEVTTDPLGEYTRTIAAQLEGLRAQEDVIRRAADAVATTIAADGLLHVFGTGHSHMLAEELFYRAGGLAAINPVLIEGLLLHAGAELSTTMERTAGLGDVIFERLSATAADTLLVVSNSGANVIARELVERARAAGMTTIAIVSLAHARSAASRGSGAPRIDELADIVIDNLGVAGDAAVEVDGVERPMGPTSTVVGTAIVNVIAMTAAQLAVERGVQPVVFTSSNVAGGDEQNRAALERYRARVRSL